MYRLFSALGALALVLFTAAPAVTASEHLSAPAGQVLLTVTGKISNTNVEGAAQFDLDMLRSLGTETIETSTIWTEGTQIFVGVPLKTLLTAVGASGTAVSASAINDYTVEIPLSDATEGGPILAFEMNGSQMSRRDKGPLWIVYPYDSASEYRSEVVYSRSIWQLDRMKITQ